MKLLEDFNWKFNAAIDRVQIEQLATGEFVRRGDNLVFVGQSGVGKSHLMQALGRQCCVLALRAQVPMSRILELLAFRPTRARGPQLRGPCRYPTARRSGHLASP